MPARHAITEAMNTASENPRMIRYNNKAGIFSTILKRRGSVFPQTLPPALLCGLITLAGALTDLGYVPGYPGPLPLWH